MLNKIGYACIPVRVDFKTTRKVKLKNSNEKIILDLINLNLQDLQNILKYNIENDIYLFRISSDIIPFGSLLKTNYKGNFKEILDKIGHFIIQNNIRVSMHPGQYLVLNSNDKKVIRNSIDDLIYHFEFLDSLNIDYTHKIIIHIGGKYNDKKESIKRFINNYNNLDDILKKRIIIENDEKNFNFEDIYYIFEYTGAPIVFDFFHDLINPSNYKYDQIFNLIKKTWKREDGNPKVHYSDKSPYKKIGAHSEFIILENFVKFYNLVKENNFDIMLETKDKDISAIKVINFVNSINNMIAKNKIFDEWSRYKYLIMMSNYNEYKELSNLISKIDLSKEKFNYNNLEKNIIYKFYNKIDSILIKRSFKNIKSTLEHIGGYFKNIELKEKKRLKTYLKNFGSGSNDSKDLLRILNYLYKLSQKYNINYIKNQYLFFYKDYIF